MTQPSSSKRSINSVLKELALSVVTISTLVFVLFGIIDAIGHMFQPPGVVHGPQGFPPHDVVFLVLVFGAALGGLRYFRPRAFGVVQVAFGITIASKIAFNDMTPDPVVNAVVLSAAAFVIGRGLADALPPRGTGS